MNPRVYEHPYVLFKVGHFNKSLWGVTSVFSTYYKEKHVAAACVNRQLL